MILDYNSISIGEDIQKQNCLAFKQSPCTCNFFAKPAFTTFFQSARISTFCYYMLVKLIWNNWNTMHGWNMTPWKSQVDGMNGLDFRGKTVGPVYFETVGIYKFVCAYI